jgi:hypothetical protein
MKTLKTLLFSSLILLLSVSVRAQAKYVSESGNFSIQFPGTPKESSQDVETDLGTIKMYSIMYQDPSGSPVYMIAYCDYSADAIKVSDPDSLLKNSMEGFLKSLDIPKDMSKTVKLEKKYNGIYFEGKSDKYATKNYNYLVDNRLFQVAILTMGDYLSKSENDKYFNSFKLLKK